MALPAAAGGNLLPSSSFDHPDMVWAADGNGMTAAPDPAVRHSTGRAWRAVDRGPQMGQTSSPMLAVQDSTRYFVKLWVQIDPAMADKLVVDIQCFRGDRTLRGGAIAVATLDKSQRGWVRVAKMFTPRVGAELARIRVMPAASDSASHGGAWIDDVVFKEVKDITDADLDLTRTQPAQQDDQVLRVNFHDTAGPVAGGFDFEDMQGWTLRYPPGMDDIRLTRSKRQLCEGDHVAMLTYQTIQAGHSIELAPPSPIVVDKPFDTVTMWIGQFFDNFVLANVMWANGPTPRVNLVDAEGKRHRVVLSRVVWQNWSVARGKLPEALAAPVKIQSIGLDSLPACATLGGPRSYPGTAPRRFAFDALRFTDEGAAKIDLPMPQTAAPTTPDTLLPDIDTGGSFKTTIEEGEDQITLTYRGADETVIYTYRPRTGTLDDLSASVDGGPSFQPMAGAGAMFAGQVQRELVSIHTHAEAVTARWRWTVAGEATELTYQLRIKQKSLLLKVSTSETRATGFAWGGVGGAPAKSFYVPYLIWNGWQKHHTVYLVDGSVFVSRVPDIYVSDFSKINYDGKQGVSQYLPLTDGSRRPLNEQWIITASAIFDHVLPNIPHPPSKAAKQFAPYVYARDHLQSYRTRRGRETSLQYLRLGKRFGVDRLIIKVTHLSTDNMDWGLLPTMNVYDQVPRTTEGGAAAFAQFVAGIQDMGFKALIYTDFLQLDPGSEFWNPDHALQRSDGQWMDSWRHCYRFTPLAQPAAAQAMTRRVKELFNVDGVYLDESGSGPWLTDYDARKPGAGLGRVAHQAQLAMVAAQAAEHGGPTYGEGGLQWFWAGFLSGAYGQSYWPAWNEAHMWLVDFELRKVHPLMTNLSMGYALSRYGGLPTDDRIWARDRFHAAAIAFGHAGCFKVPLNVSEGDHIDGPRWIWRQKGELFNEYMTFAALQEAYALTAVKSIGYERGGQEYRTSDAIRHGVVDDNHVHVAYENGLHVYVNGGVSQDDIWQIKRGEKTYHLPQNGFLFELPGRLIGYGALVNGHRVDFVDGPRYLWADARGEHADFGPLSTAGCVVIRKPVNDVVLVSGDAVTLNKEVQAQALDIDENPTEGGKAIVANGRTTLHPTPMVISYRLAPR